MREFAAVSAAVVAIVAAAAGPVQADPSRGEGRPAAPLVVAFDDTSRPGDAPPRGADAGPSFQVNLCNKSAYQPIWAMVTYKFRPTDADLSAAGWYRIDGNSCRPFRGSFGTWGKVYFGYYAEWEGGKRVWEGNRQATVCADRKAFRRALTKGYTCGSGEKLVKVHSMWVERAAPTQSINLN